MRSVRMHAAPSHAESDQKLLELLIRFQSPSAPGFRLMRKPNRTEAEKRAVRSFLLTFRWKLGRMPAFAKAISPKFFS